MVGADRVLPDPQRLAASLRLAWQISTRAKWRSLRSECRSVLQNVLTPPTLLEMAMLRQSSARLRNPVLTCVTQQSLWSANHVWQMVPKTMNPACESEVLGRSAAEFRLLMALA